MDSNPTNVPYNTGKVKIGLLHEQRRSYITEDGAFWQSVFNGSYRAHVVARRREAARVAFWLAVVATVFVINKLF